MAANVRVAGYVGKIDDPEVFVEKLRGASKSVGETVEAYDAGIVLGAEHVVVAWARAERAHASGRAVAGSVAMEARLFLSCEGQIKSAMARTGVKRGGGGVVLASGSDSALDEAAKVLGLKRDDSVLEPTPEKLAAWGIDPKSPDLIFERMSLLEVER